MTPNDFDRWWNDAQTRWPSLQGWLGKSFPEATRKVEFLRNWRAVLSDVAIADALEVNTKMQSGDLAWVGEYDHDKERLPQHVRRLARQLVSDRQPSPHREELPPEGSRAGGFPGGKILLRWQQLMAAGVVRDEARRIALEELPVGTSPHREPRYNCHLCLDSGRVLVASNTAIEAMLLCAFDKCHHRDAVVLCKCKAHVPANPKRPLAVYEAGLDFKISDPLWSERETLRFAEWVEDQRQKRAVEMAKTATNYEPAFASYNQRDAWSERSDIQ